MAQEQKVRRNVLYYCPKCGHVYPRADEGLSFTMAHGWDLDACEGPYVQAPAAVQTVFRFSGQVAARALLWTMLKEPGQVIE